MSKSLKRFPKEDKELHSKEARAAESLLFDQRQAELEKAEPGPLDFNDDDLCWCDACKSKRTILNW